MIWDHLDAAIHTVPADVANYQFSLSVDDKPWVTALAVGSVNIDSLLLKLDHMAITAACDSAKPPPLPQVALVVIRQLKIVDNWRLMVRQACRCVHRNV